MAGEWSAVELANVATIGSGKRPIRVSKKPSDPYLIPVVGGGGTSGYTDSALFDGNILITGRVGTLGKLFAPDEPCWPSDNALVIRAKGGEIDFRFLRYALQSVISKTVGMNRGAANPLVTQGDLGRLQISHPQLPEQRAIAHILGTLDNKIELNRKQNETLEAMAQTLFKAWFVDFEPVRAKMDGRWQRGQSLPGLPAHLYDLFPDRLVESELGEIPVDWELRPLRDFAVLKGGKQLEKEHIAEAGPVPVFGGAGVMGYTINHNADGFVISVGRVGAYCGQFFSHRGKAWINNNASLIRPDSKVSGEWLFLALRSIDMDVIKKGAAQPFVSNGDIANVRLVWPGDSIIRAFSSAMAPLMTKAEANERETLSLAQLRDTLLPKLISGDLRIPDAETFLTERGL